MDIIQSPKLKSIPEYVNELSAKKNHPVLAAPAVGNGCPIKLVWGESTIIVPLYEPLYLTLPTTESGKIEVGIIPFPSNPAYPFGWFLFVLCSTFNT